jgi:S-adenosylmethionine:tRNA ribosyltransferase-isomerase
VKTSDFDYTLPPELIAQTPIEPRDASRLLVVDRATGQLSHRRFSDLLEYLRPGDLLVGNDSRVIPARLHGIKPTGGAVEIFLLRPHQPPEIASAQTTGLAMTDHVAASLRGAGLAPKQSPSSSEIAHLHCTCGCVQVQVSAQTTGLAMTNRGEMWECLVRGKGLRPGVRVRIDPKGFGKPLGSEQITATIVAETEDGGRVVAFDPPVEEWLWSAGEVPLPPYIHQPLVDAERYQTVYSRIEGSVASSTAGLHFTPEMLIALRATGVGLAFVTLHIGLDTFRPVQVEDLDAHPMHREWAQVSVETARAVNETRLAGGRVIAVGTTVVRTLESAAKIALGYRPAGVVNEPRPELVEGPPFDKLRARSSPADLHPLPEDAVCGWQAVAAFTGETDLFIRPGHRFRAVDVMVTNFHLPRSTLLMLVSAFAGKALMDRAYAEAIRERYRFYSFGDAMFIG